MFTDKLKKYKGESDYSYTLGIYPTIELLKNKPNLVKNIIFHPEINTSEGYEKIVKLCKENNIEPVINSFPFKILSSKENVYVIGVFDKYKSSIVKNEDTLVLNNPENAGNVGTIIRTMVGFGVNNLVIIKPSVDLFSPEVIRASMGAIFKNNFEYFESLAAYKAVTANNFYYFGGGGEDLASSPIDHPFSLIFGNEGSGLSQEDILSGKKLTIKMSNNIDSYNLAVAVGIALFHAKK